MKLQREVLGSRSLLLEYIALTAGLAAVAFAGLSGMI